MIESWNPVEPDDLHTLLVGLRLDLTQVLAELDGTPDHETRGWWGRRRRTERAEAA